MANIALDRMSLSILNIQLEIEKESERHRMARVSQHALDARQRASRLRVALFVKNLRRCVSLALKGLLCTGKCFVPLDVHVHLRAAKLDTAVNAFFFFFNLLGKTVDSMLLKSIVIFLLFF